jgi:hypothetical protein
MAYEYAPLPGGSFFPESGVSGGAEGVRFPGERVPEGAEGTRFPGERVSGGAENAAKAPGRSGHTHGDGSLPLRKRDGFDGECPLCECQTCKNRRYQDKSDDGTVSFQMPTTMGPEEAASMVRSHEQEHVRNEQLRARENGEEVVAQSVRIIYGTCQECGKTYVAGGETRTITKYVNPDYYDLFRVGAEDITRKKGGLLNAVA